MMFVVLEGADGVGKSTQVEVVADWFRTRGHEVVTTFEPGATPSGRALRELVLGSDVPPVAETLLMAADRAVHVAEVIGPALARGAVVISDRFSPSTLAYQGVGRDLGVERVEQLCSWAADGVEPDLVIVLDAAVEVAAARREGSEDRLEGRDLQARVRDAYRALAAERGWVVVDAEGPVAEVSQRVEAVLAAKMVG